MTLCKLERRREGLIKEDMIYEGKLLLPQLYDYYKMKMGPQVRRFCSKLKIPELDCRMRIERMIRLNGRMGCFFEGMDRDQLVGDTILARLAVSFMSLSIMGLTPIAIATGISWGQRIAPSSVRVLY